MIAHNLDKTNLQIGGGLQKEREEFMRPFWNGALSFGLVNIPVSLFPATKSERVAFHFLHKKDLGRIHNERICDTCGKTIAYDDLMRGFEYDKDKSVPFTKEELETAHVESSRSVDILDFVDEKEIDPMYFQKPYYAIPDKKGAKAYALLHTALQKSGKVGIAKVVFHTREHLACVRASEDVIMIELMHFSMELKKPDEFKFPEKQSTAGAKELKMAQQLIDSMTVSFQPEKYQNTFENNLHQLIEKKLEGKTFKKIPQKQTTDNVIDIMAKLKASLAKQTKKSGGSKRKMA